MSKDYEFNLYGQPSLYKASERTFKVFFSEPDNGCNSETGILLFISGYGQNPSSNVYKKMRSKFADKYNLLTVQCEYFGIEFMQTPSEISLDRDTWMKIINSQISSIELRKELNEKEENMNDMGLLQAIDNLTAVASILEIIKNNNLEFNKNKIIIYGYSHGAYIAHLCNLFSPNLFSTIIDNSGYIYPVYLGSQINRKVSSIINKLTICTKYRYLINDIVFDKQIYDLSILYPQVKNNCKIISLQGDQDELYDYREKINFINSIDNGVIELITINDVDGVKFKSNTHGLDADFIKVFEYINDKYELERKNDNRGFSNVEYKTKEYIYRIDYSLGVPKLSYIHK